MKKSFLLVGILSISTIFADSIEKNGVNFQWEQFGGKIYFVREGRPYSLKITNNSPHAIEISKSVISTPLIPYQEIQRAMQKKISRALLASTGIQAMSLIFTLKTKHPVFLLTVFVGMGMSSYLTYKLFTHHSLKQRVLDEPITIQPGQSVTKIFWLQNPGQLVAGKWGILSNPKGQFSIDFDAIKVLK